MKTMPIFPTDNEYGIPALDPDMQGKVIPPVISWGSRSRAAQMLGTWSFYVDDYRFSSLEKDPSQLLVTSCACATEINFSLFDYSTKAETIWATFRKRQISRSWQEDGISIFVDLNVPKRYIDISLLGVPKGWKSFSTRGYDARKDSLKEEHQIAMDYSGGSPIFLVVGGGSKIQKLCQEMKGAIYAPGHWEYTESNIGES